MSGTDALAYTDEGAGPAVVLIHGLTFNRGAWAPIIERARDRVRCIAVDLPGHGGSTGPMSAWELPPLVHELLDGLGVDAPVVVGHSLGGALALLQAASYPASGVVSVDQGPDVASMGPLARAIAPALEGPGFERAWSMARQSIGRDLVREPHRSRLLAEDEARPEVIRAYWADLIADPDALQRRVDAVLRKIHVPVLAVFGHELGEAGRAAVREAFPDAEVAIEEWQGGGHCVHLVDPDRFAERLVAFTLDCTGRSR